MKIAGLVKNSFVDYPQQIAAVVFTSGCNMDCWFCHNSELIHGNCRLLPQQEVFNFLLSRIGKIDAVVISGGEPTLQPNLKQFILAIKSMGFLVKLDTNGSNPQVLAELLQEGLLNFVAMDIKAPPHKLERVAKAFDLSNKIMQSIALLKSSNIDYEFRTTLVPELDLQDLQEMTTMIKGAKNYVLQKYRPIDSDVITIPHNQTFIQNALKIAKNNVQNTFLRGF